MELIEFNVLHKMKKERQELKVKLEQGRMPICNYIDTLEELVEAQDEYIVSLQGVKEAQEELIKLYEERE